MANIHLNENKLVNVAVVYMLLKKLVTPFKDTAACKLGIIDQDGKILRKSTTLKTRQEQDAYTLLDRVIFKIKRLIGMIPGGKSKIGTFAAAMWLIKETKNFEKHDDDNEEETKKDLAEFITNYKLDEQSGENLDLVEMLEDPSVFDKILKRKSLNERFLEVFGV